MTEILETKKLKTFFESCFCDKDPDFFKCGIENLPSHWAAVVSVVEPHTYTCRKIIKRNLRTSMNERTHFFIKIYLSHIILKRVDISVVVWEMGRESGLLLPISFSRSQRVPTLAPPCKLVGDASDRLRVPRSTAILCTLSKSDRVVLINVVSFRLHTFSTWRDFTFLFTN